MSNRRRPRRTVPLQPPPPPPPTPGSLDELAHEIRDSTLRGLMSCTGDVDCASSIHVPGCWATR